MKLRNRSSSTKNLRSSSGMGNSRGKASQDAPPRLPRHKTTENKSGDHKELKGLDISMSFFRGELVMFVFVN